MKENNRKSPHILSTSANLLGFCLVVITSLKVTQFGTVTIIDDVTGIAAICLMLSCILSFLSMRSDNDNRAETLEKSADWVFMTALIFLSASIVLVSFNLFK